MEPAATATTNQWKMDIPAEPTPRLLVVKNISLKTEEATIKDFFSFCGIITAFEMQKDAQDDQHQVALVLFEKEAAAKTASLLSQAEVDDSPIEVESYFKQAPAATTPAAAGATASPAETTTRESIAQHSQESKPASHVMAELLASGYILTESVINKGAEFDAKHGVSTRVNGYLNKMGVSLTHLNQRFHSQEKVASRDAPVAASATVPPSRMHHLMNSRAGLKMQGFASRVADKVSNVHEEAKRIAAEKRAAAAATGTGTATNTTTPVTPANDDHKPEQRESPSLK